MAGDPDVGNRGGSYGTPVQIGSYRLLHPLGAGGMSSVYRAVHRETGHEVALKVLPRSLAKNPTMLQRFLREAKSAESLQHPNIVEIFDRGSDGGRYYLALEFVPGSDLHEKVRADGPLPAAQAVDIIKQVCRGLRYAASRGVIHRDIKPANILLTPDGHVKVTDLGLALQSDDDDERVTRDGTTVGTVDYMAPEQARDSRATNVRSDIYSLGCTLYFLLTGKAPFPEGDVPERLRKHAYDAPPDVHRVRPDLPEALVRLVQRMMAKKPENRFHDYDELLQFLDALPPMPVTGMPVVLVDDSEESPREPVPRGPLDLSPVDLREDDRPLPVPETMDLPHAHLPDQGDNSLRNLMRDEREGQEEAMPPLAAPAAPGSSGFELGPVVRSVPGSPGSTLSAPGSSRIPPSTPARPPQRPRPESPPAPPERVATPRSPAGRDGVDPSGRAASDQAPSDETDAPGPAAPPIPSGFVRPKPPTERQPISVQRLTKGALQASVGLVVLLAGWSALQFLLNSSQKPGETVEKEADPGLDVVPAGVLKAEGGVFWIPPAMESQASRPSEKGSPTPPASPSPAPAAPPWTEPTETASAVPATPPIDPQAIASLGLEDVVAGPPVRWPGPVTTVRRAVSDRGRGTLDSVRRSLDQIAGTIEIADDGPFFEQDFRINGSPRAIRAAEGYRPALVVEAPRLPSVRARPAAVTLDDKKTLILQGLDLVVRASDLPANQTAVFLCLGGDLLLRDCTVTVEGQRPTPLAVFQLGQAGVAASGSTGRLRLERTLIRCPGATVIRLAEGPASVQVVDSLILAGPAPLIGVGGARDTRRQIDLVRTALAAQGAMLELAGAAAASDSRPTELRLLDCTLAHLGDTPASGLIVQRDVPGPARSEGLGVSWKGRGNAYAGWPPTATAALGDDGAAAPLSFEASAAAPPLEAWSDPVALLASLGEAGARHTRVARPRANLAAWTLGAFPLLQPAAPLGELPGMQVLAFDADDSRLNGDLGRYLAEAVDPRTRSVRLAVRGNGRKWVTPFALRPGTTLQIVVAPPAPGGEPLLFVPRETAEGDALIVVRDAALSLVGAQFERDARPVLKHLIRVEHGRLRLERCTIRAAMQVEPDGGNLIAFQTDGTRPLLGSESDAPAARPEWVSSHCLFMTGGRVLDASVGRGLIRFEQSTLVAGSVVFRLNPAAVSPARFEADLQLDRCTVVSERDVVRFGPWTGGAPGPERPWVVATRGSALFDAFDRGPAPSTTVLLRSNADALARGSIVWQSDHDAYAVSQFVTTGDVDQTPTSFPDLRRDWVGFWGESHVLQPVEAKGLIRLGRERLRPGAVEPRDVVIRALNPRGPALNLGSDTSVIESEVPLSKPTLPPTNPAKTGPIK